MNKKITSVCLMLIIFIGSLSTVSASGNPQIYGVNAVIEELSTGEALYSKKADEKMYPASMTKVLTVITAMELIKDINEEVTITQQDLDTVFETGASAANFEVGEVVTYEDILMGALIPSGADATRALGFNLCDTQEKFVKEMNSLAKKIGCKNSNFVNTTGIHDPDHYTTASDMAAITRYALQNKTFKEMFGVNTYTSSNKLHVWTKRIIRNANRSGIDTSMITGCKSGYTKDAEHTLASVVNVNGHDYVTVVGFCKDTDTVSSTSVLDTVSLGNYVKDNYSFKTIIKQGSKLTDISVSLGEESEIKIDALEDVEILTSSKFKESDLKYDYKIKEVEAPVKKGAKLGTLTVTLDGVTKYETDLIASTSVKRSTFKSIMNSLGNFLLPYGLIIILALLVMGFLVAGPKRRRRRNKKRR